MFAVNFLTYLVGGGNSASPVSSQGTDNASSANTFPFRALLHQALQLPVDQSSGNPGESQGLFPPNAAFQTNDFNSLVHVETTGETDPDVKAIVARTYPHVQLAKSGTIWKFNAPVPIQVVKNGKEISVAATAVQFISARPVTDDTLRTGKNEIPSVPIAFLAVTVEGARATGQSMNLLGTKGSTSIRNEPIKGTEPSLPAAVNQSGKLLVPILLAQGEQLSGDSTWGTTVFHSPSEAAVRVEVGDGEWLPLIGQRNKAGMGGDSLPLTKPSLPTVQGTTVGSPQSNLQPPEGKPFPHFKYTPLVGMKAEHSTGPLVQAADGKQWAMVTQPAPSVQTGKVQSATGEAVRNAEENPQAKPFASGVNNILTSSLGKHGASRTERLMLTSSTFAPGISETVKDNAPSVAQRMVQQREQAGSLQEQTAAVTKPQAVFHKMAGAMPSRLEGQAGISGRASGNVSSGENEGHAVNIQNLQPAGFNDSSHKSPGDVLIPSGKPAGTIWVDDAVSGGKTPKTASASPLQQRPSMLEAKDTTPAQIQQTSETLQLLPSGKAKLLQVLRQLLSSGNAQSGAQHFQQASGNYGEDVASTITHPRKGTLERVLKSIPVSNTSQGKPTLLTQGGNSNSSIERTFMPAGKPLMTPDGVPAVPIANVVEMVQPVMGRLRGKTPASQNTFQLSENALEPSAAWESTKSTDKSGNKLPQMAKPVTAQELPTNGDMPGSRFASAPHVERGTISGKTTIQTPGNAGAAETMENELVKSPLLSGTEGGMATKVNSAKGIVQNTPMNLPPMTARLEDVMEMITRWTEQMRYRTTATQQEITIQLRPETLGAIRVWLSMKENKLHARIETQRPEAAAVIHQSSEQLISRLEEMNIHVQQFDVQTNSEFSAFHARQGSPEQFAGQTENGSQFEPENNTTDNATRQPRWVGYNTIDLIA